MTGAERILFNLIVNATFSFLAGLLVVEAIIYIFQIETGRWKLYLLGLPFVKILWDLLHGIPKDSYLYSGLNPLFLPPKHTTLSVGAGFSQFGPDLTVLFSVQSGKSNQYSISLADYLGEWLKLHVSEKAPILFAAFLLLIAAAFIAKRIWRGVRFEGARRRERAAEDCQALPSIRVGTRSVDVYLSRLLSGTPFTGGILRPYVCVPANTYHLLTEAEREAVLQHELAHIRHHDLFFNLTIQIMGDIFWFVPLYRNLARQIDRLRELLADKVAVSLGASPEQLASALVKLKEQATAEDSPILYSAFVRSPSLLKTRVERLLDTAPLEARPRWGWDRRIPRLLIAAWATGAVMFCSLGGNHEIQQIPPWLEKLFRSWGWL